MSETPATKPGSLRRRLYAVGERFFPLWTLRWELRQFNRAYRKAIREANSLSAKRELETEEHALSQEIIGPIKEIRTRRVLRQAEDEFIDYRSFTTDDDWVQGQFGHMYLSEKALAAINRSVRDAKRAKVEFWVKVIGAVIGTLTGLIGTIIGLVAVLRKK
jgi:hypothetical protein